MVDIPATGHDWGGAEWSWNDDNSQAVLTLTCQNDPGHTIYYKAKMSERVIKIPMCENDGYKMVTASVPTSTGTRVDVKKVVLPATGHDWDTENVVWNWSEDFRSASATLECLNTPRHGAKTFDAAVTSETVLPTCLEDGYITYTATVNLDDAQEDAADSRLSVMSSRIVTDTRTVVLPAAGHTWGEPVWTWTADHAGAKAAFACINSNEHTVSLDAEVSVREESDKKVYTASVELGDRIYTNEVSVRKEETADNRGDKPADNSGVKTTVAEGTTIIYDSTPKTGDTESLPLWIAVASISAVVYFTVRRKKSEE